MQADPPGNAAAHCAWQDESSRRGSFVVIEFLQAIPTSTNSRAMKKDAVRRRLQSKMVDVSDGL